jgi:hypothetical protein
VNKFVSHMLFVTVNETVLEVNFKTFMIHSSFVCPFSQKSVTFLPLDTTAVCSVCDGLFYCCAI